MARAKDAKKTKRPYASKTSTQDGTPKPKSEQPDNEIIRDDPDSEGELIWMLRQEHNMSWLDITNNMNQGRLDRGKPASFTEAAIYSRFVRFSPRSEVDGSKNASSTTVNHLTGKKREKSKDTKEANTRKRIEVTPYGTELQSTQMTQMLEKSVSTVQANFWSYVADEMERRTTKLYDPKALEDRFNAI